MIKSAIPTACVPRKGVASLRLALGTLALGGVLVLNGCSGSLATGTSGDEGSIDLNAAKKAADTNPEIAKAAARRGGGMGGAPTKKSGK